MTKPDTLRGLIGIVISDQLGTHSGAATPDELLALRMAAADAAQKLFASIAVIGDDEEIFGELSGIGGRVFDPERYRTARLDLLQHLGFTGDAAEVARLRETVDSLQAKNAATTRERDLYIQRLEDANHEITRIEREKEAALNESRGLRSQIADVTQRLSGEANQAREETRQAQAATSEIQRIYDAFKRNLPAPDQLAMQAALDTAAKETREANVAVIVHAKDAQVIAEKAAKDLAAQQLAGIMLSVADLKANADGFTGKIIMAQRQPWSVGGLYTWYEMWAAAYPTEPSFAKYVTFLLSFSLDARNVHTDVKAGRGITPGIANGTILATIALQGSAAAFNAEAQSAALAVYPDDQTKVLSITPDLYDSIVAKFTDAAIRIVDCSAAVTALKTKAEEGKNVALLSAVDRAHSLVAQLFLATLTTRKGGAGNFLGYYGSAKDTDTFQVDPEKKIYLPGFTLNSAALDNFDKARQVANAELGVSPSDVAKKVKKFTLIGEDFSVAESTDSALLDLMGMQPAQPHIAIPINDDLDVQLAGAADVGNQMSSGSVWAKKEKTPSSALASVMSSFFADV